MVVVQIRLDLFRHVQRWSHSFQTALVGDIVARLTGDARMVRDLLIGAGVFFATCLLVIAATIAVMVWKHARLTIVAPLILRPLWGVTRHFGGRIRGASHRRRRKKANIAVVMTEGVSATFWSSWPISLPSTSRCERWHG
jgi:ABC-type multidrug transport system fused ATPase/permease subunit